MFISDKPIALLATKEDALNISNLKDAIAEWEMQNGFLIVAVQRGERGVKNLNWELHLAKSHMCMADVIKFETMRLSKKVMRAALTYGLVSYCKVLKNVYDRG